MGVAQGGFIPPSDEEAENAVLGSILLDNAVIELARAVLDVKDFWREKNRKIFGAMLVLYDAEVVIDHVTLGAKLQENGDLARIGGAAALDPLTDAVATPLNIEHYAEIVRRMSALRDVLNMARELTEKCYNRTSDEIPEEIDDLILAARRLEKVKTPPSVFEFGPKVLEEYQRAASGYRGIELPWPTVSNMTAGLWPKTVTIFVSRPSVGKTQVAVLTARTAWMNGHRVLFVSPEMRKEEIAERLFVTHARVSYYDVITGQLSSFALPRLEDTVAELEGKEGIWILDSSDGLTIATIEAAIRATRPDLVVIDSIYDLQIKGERKDRLLAALDWMKASSKKYGYACIGAAQQNRLAELSEKKGGGSRLGTIALADEVGQDAHAVFALEQTKDMRTDKQMRIKPLKLRRGQSGGGSGVLVHWDFDSAVFDEVSTTKSETGYEDSSEDLPF